MLWVFAALIFTLISLRHRRADGPLVGQLADGYLAGTSVTTVCRSIGKYFLNASCTPAAVTASMRSRAMQNHRGILSRGGARSEAAAASRRSASARFRSCARADSFARFSQVRGRPVLLQPSELP